MPSPMPREPPVTSAVVPMRRMGVILSVTEPDAGRFCPRVRHRRHRGGSAEYGKTVLTRPQRCAERQGRRCRYVSDVLGAVMPDTLRLLAITALVLGVAPAAAPAFSTGAVLLAQSGST